MRRFPPAWLGQRHAAIAMYSLLLVILLLGAALRFHRLGAQSLWYDEAVSYSHALRPLPELLLHLQHDVHAPAYFALLGWWRELAGESEFALRAFSALGSLLSVAWAYALGQRLFGPAAGMAAAALVALNSFSIHYAQEVRMYAMLAAIAGASMWLFAGLPRRRRGAVLALGLVNALGMYTHLAYALVILAQLALTALWLAVDRAWRPALDAARANALAIVAFLPWLPIAIDQISSLPNLSQALPPSGTLRLLLNYVIFGGSFEHASQDLGIAAAILLLAGMLPRGRRMLLPILWLTLSLLVYISLELTTRYIRFLLPAQLAAALWLGRGFWWLWALRLGERSWLRLAPKLAAAIALGALLLTQFSGLQALYHHPDFQRDDMRSLTRQIESDLRPGDAIIVSTAGLQDLLRYYYRGAAPIFPLPTSADADNTRAQVLDIIAESERQHVIFYGAAEQDPKLVVESTLNAAAFEVSDSWVDDLRYARYISPAPIKAPIAAELDFGAEIRLRSYALQAGALKAGAPLRVEFLWTARQPPSRRYKVFLQLLNDEGALVAQRDSEPAAGSAPSTSWTPGAAVRDRHGLWLPPGLPAGDYRLIAGLYDRQDPAARLPVNGETFVDLGLITLE